MILIDKGIRVFDLSEVGSGTLISAKHRTWTEGQPGIVTYADEQVIRVQYPPTIQNVLNHYFIYASEAMNGEWDIRYSNDGLQTIKVHPEAGD